MKLKELQQELKSKNLDAAIFFKNDPNISYFAEFEAEFSMLVVPAREAPLLLLTRFDTERAGSLKIKWDYWPQDIFSLLKKYDFKRFGFDATRYTVKDLEDFKKNLGGDWQDISGIVWELRKTKTPEEIRILDAACKETDKIFAELIKNIKKFKTEADAARFLTHKAEEFSGVSFPAIVASADHASQPHYIPKSHPIKKGFLVVDYGIKYKRYCSDVTRTIYIGNPSKEEIELYSKVLQVQEKCIKMCNPGTVIEDIQKFAEKELGKDFIHSLGHGLGIEVHEEPRFKSKEVLKPGMVITIEPGIYLPGRLGIRIEDDILITEKGPKVLSRAPKGLVTLS